MEFSLIFMMQIFSSMFGAWIGFYVTHRFFTKLRQEEELTAQRKKFDADVIYIQNSVHEIRAEFAEMDERLNNLSCRNSVCSTGDGKTFNCIEACKELEEQLKELKAVRNVS